MENFYINLKIRQVAWPSADFHFSCSLFPDATEEEGKSDMEVENVTG